jgi:hypothetical protein
LAVYDIAIELAERARQTPGFEPLRGPKRDKHGQGGQDDLLHLHASQSAAVAFRILGE